MQIHLKCRLQMYDNTHCNGKCIRNYMVEFGRFKFKKDLLKKEKTTTKNNNSCLI